MYKANVNDLTKEQLATIINTQSSVMSELEQRLADAEQVIATLPVDDCAIDLSLCIHDELIEIIMDRDKLAREYMSKHKEGGG